MTTGLPTRPITLLVAALGGEGGGVLTDWIVAAAAKLGFPVQSTSIPGVAQRTGATTYYIEIVPVPTTATDGRRPVLALTPGIGDIDIMAASELLEAGRAIANGYVTPDRTLLIASTHRVFVTTEKMAMSDGRYDSEKLLAAAEEHAQALLLLDLDALARQAGAIINSVMLGTIAGCGRLPIAPDVFEAVIREDGKAVETNLRGFRAGLAAAQAGAAESLRQPAPKRPRHGDTLIAELEAEVAQAPEAARAVILEGVRRLTGYQDAAYARRYLERLRPVADADARAGAGGELLREVARHLALRMSFEDIIRVAQAKVDPARLDRIARETGARGDEPVRVTEFLKPGVEEFTSVMPPFLARAVLRLAARSPRLARFHWGMELETTSIFGYLRLRGLAKLRAWRPRSYRFAQEQAGIDAWLGLVLDAARISPALAHEVAACAGLIKGYSDTLRRGVTNYETIVAEVIRPALAGGIAPALAVDAVASARAAALADPEGQSLARCLAELRERPALAVAAE